MSKPEPDWERIEANYRPGLMSLREIATADGNVTEGAIRKRAKRDNWSRDLNAKVQQRAEELVRKDEVRKAVRKTVAVRTKDAEIVEINAAALAQVKLTHRAEIGRARKLAMTLLAELEAQTEQLPEFRNLGAALRAPDANGVDRLNEIYNAVISLPERTKTMKALAEAIRIVVGLERESWGMAAASAVSTPDPGPAPDLNMDPAGYYAWLNSQGPRK